MDDMQAIEELRMRLVDAEARLKEAEEDYTIYASKLEEYKDVINKQKEIIRAVKMRMKVDTNHFIQ